MQTHKVLVSFRNYTDTSLDQKALSIVTAMTGNANFPTPAPELTVVSAAINDFQSAMSDAATGDHTATEIKNQKRAALESLLKQLGTYVDLESEGNVAVMLSSGFDISKEHAPIGPLGKPAGLTAVASGKGQVKLSVYKMNGAYSYQFEYKQVADAAWQTTIVTKTKLLLTGLTSGMEYMFRVLPIGASSVREYSDTVSSFVL